MKEMFKFDVKITGMPEESLAYMELFDEAKETMMQVQHSFNLDETDTVTIYYDLIAIYPNKIYEDCIDEDYLQQVFINDHIIYEPEIIYYSYPEMARKRDREKIKK